jgi:hypothetical protein
MVAKKTAKAPSKPRGWHARWGTMRQTPATLDAALMYRRAQPSFQEYMITGRDSDLADFLDGLVEMRWYGVTWQNLFKLLSQDQTDVEESGHGPGTGGGRGILVLDGYKIFNGQGLGAWARKKDREEGRDLGYERDPKRKKPGEVYMSVVEVVEPVDRALYYSDDTIDGEAHGGAVFGRTEGTAATYLYRAMRKVSPQSIFKWLEATQIRHDEGTGWRKGRKGVEWFKPDHYLQSADELKAWVVKYVRPDAPKHKAPRKKKSTKARRKNPSAKRKSKTSVASLISKATK